MLKLSLPENSQLNAHRLFFNENKTNPKNPSRVSKIPEPQAFRKEKSKAVLEPQNAALKPENKASLPKKSPATEPPKKMTRHC